MPTHQPDEYYTRSAAAAEFASALRFGLDLSFLPQSGWKPEHGSKPLSAEVAGRPPGSGERIAPHSQAKWDRRPDHEPGGITLNELAMDEVGWLEHLKMSSRLMAWGTVDDRPGDGSARFADTHNGAGTGALTIGEPDHPAVPHNHCIEPHGRVGACPPTWTAVTSDRSSANLHDCEA